MSSVSTPVSVDGTYVGAGVCMDVKGQHACTALGGGDQKL